MTMSTDSTTPGSEPPTPELEKRIKSERPLFFASFLMPLIAIGSMLALLGYYLYHGHPEMAIILTITATLLSLLIGLLARQVWRVQQRERKSAENLKRAQAVAHVGSWDFDLLHNQLTCSDETFSIFGRPNHSPITYATFLDHIHPGDRDRVEIAWQEALKGEPYDLEHRIVVKGEPQWVHQKALVSFDASGRPVAAIGTVRDIAEQKRAEECHRLATSVFSNSHDGIVITDPSNRIIEVNQAFCDVTGYAREDVLGQNPGLLNSGRQDAAFYRVMWEALNDTGHWSGEIWNRRKNGESYVELLSISAVKNAHGQITHYVGAFSDITSLKTSQQQLEHLAHFDALTHLPNRILLADRIEQDIAHAIRHEQWLAICFIDLDSFKPINDMYGHETGDRLLIEVANWLKDAVRSGDTVARLGGDEFVLLLTDLKAMDELEITLSRILLKMSAPYLRLAEQELQISASMGVTLFPLDGTNPDVLLRQADQAMYAAKQAGRNRYHMFDAKQDRLVRARCEHLTRLRDALANEEFRLHYQPKVNLRTGKVIGAEALIRWQHPEQGLLLPGEFIPLIEESDLIIDIGDWVMKETLRQMGQWAAVGLILPVSVNIAIRHLQQADFMKRLELILAEYPDVPSSWLELEILETTALADMGYAQKLIEACRSLGVSFALDDFGTGYSSLSYLKRLSADTLKIDQSFIRDMLDDPEALAIVEGVIGLTTAFQRTVIAEGVETVEHGVMLMRLGCDLAQGYGIARPMPGDSLPEWVRQYQPAQAWRDAAPLLWGREEYPLLTVGIDHKHWVARVLHALEKELPHTPIELVNHHHCRFGRWYHGIGMKYYGNLPEFEQIGPLHERVHDLGKDIILLRDTGQMEQARALAQELIHERDRVLELLARLQIEVALTNERAAVS
ncbi:MAG: GGDEF domain-containing protein [Hydrogenophilales bacterium CG_4_9_14_3_um_filter_59_35]|nr:MAG: GGDEF domain-containing protein [Hydrogenophilales bacterium CG18_big_fil_WC_8_21_14_2_50_58_12]PJB06240.1 MAG: GGDEF domain-containing protein [Hydrogenophilales bacterium CG_4_9_14_3_um_filter_59_35]